MKKIKCSIFLLLGCFVAARTTAQYHFEIKGYIDNKADASGKNNLKDGDIIKLQFLNISRIDTAYIKNDSFTIRDQVPYPSIAMLESKYGGDAFDIDNSSYNFYLTQRKVDSTHFVYDSKIETASAFYNRFDNLRTIRSPLDERKSLLQDSLQQTKNKDSLLYYTTKIKAIDDSLITIYNKFVEENPNSYLVAYTFPNIPGFSYEKYIGMYNSFPDSVKNSFYGKNFYSRLMASKDAKPDDDNIGALTGNELPTVSSVDTAYKRYELNKDFYARHKYTLIEFWASWCGPCRKVNRDLIKKKDLFDKKDILIVGFSLDNVGEPWKIAVGEDKPTWLQISDLKAMDSPFAKYLKLEFIPFNIIVDSAGKIVRQNIYGDDLDNFVNAVN